DQKFLLARLDRSEADAAVAHDDGGNAVPARRTKERIPRHLAVIVGVDIDPSGRDEEAGRVDLATGGACFAADAGDYAVVDRDVAGEGGRSAAIDNFAVSDYEIMHRFGLLLSSCSLSSTEPNPNRIAHLCAVTQA